MAGEKFDKFSADVTEGVEVNTSDFAQVFGYLWDSYNLSNGIQQGLGPIYGTSAIPGHNTNVTQTSNDTPGFRQATSPSALYGLAGAVGILHIYPVKMTNPTGFASQGTFWAFVVFRAESNVYYVDVVFASTYDGTRWAYSTDLSKGLHQDLVTAAASYGWSVEMCDTTTTTSKVSGAKTMMNVGASGVTSSVFTNPPCSVLMSCSGPDIPAAWLLAKTTSSGGGSGATTAPSGSFQVFQAVGSSINWYAFTSAPAEWNLSTYDKKKRRPVVYALLTDGQINMIYKLAAFNPASVFAAQARYGSTETHINLSGVTATKTTGGTNYTSNAMIVYHDSQARISSSYKAFLTAAQKPICHIIQDWAVSANGCLPQAVDLSNIGYFPQTIDTATYTENGTERNTCFYRWPLWVQDTALVPVGSNGPYLSGQNTGILRAATNYELTYSVFNKRLNYESNVGRGVKFCTDSNDFQSLVLFHDTGTVRTPAFRYGSGASSTWIPIPMPSQDATASGDLNWDINNLQYRFYYRPLGTYQWLPAGNFDAVELWYQPGDKYLCVSAVAGLPGGQPGGFTDYSNLPQDKYDCVVQYKNRAFWFSPKACYFSLKNNVLAYPANNSFTAITGEFRGAIVHNYPGQAEQSSRLIIFGSKETYVGRFTGAPVISPVQVSPDTIGEYPLDGSDFVLDAWTSVTAFSYRSAVVADGILYWWGPLGIFRDDGVNTPTKISQDLEPDIFTIVDGRYADSVQAYFNSQTKEIIWNYTPTWAYGTTLSQRVSACNSYALVYDLRAGRFRRFKYEPENVEDLLGYVDYHSIDRMFDLDTTASTGDSFVGIPRGSRTVALTRYAPYTLATQYPYFFDANNRAGWTFGPTMILVAAVDFPTSDHTLIRFTFDPASTGMTASIGVGDIVSVQANQVPSLYGSAQSAVGVVEAVVNAATDYIDVRFQTADIISPVATGTVAKGYRFAIFGDWTNDVSATLITNAIPWKASSAYWMPNGVNYWAWWRYFYFMFLYTKWDGADAEFTFAYRTPVSPSDESETITLTDNSDGNSQIYHPLTVGNMNAEGQALKVTMSGSHIGHQWVLQYLEAHCQPIEGDQLKIFER